ncbi:hypothetical protein [Salimicrobium halophilum]|uniref:Uncharacterized protein n=1 Tax=Salimicrobium halophilum TaxID=86666 RepID=A0A1G8T5X9_9BACI|nr:hypothetical protein [Salimicrobium halophilum]SDJ36110.1 hypothetical protein SAMN04490247_1686 [Salimicrobium halophilum]
METFGLMGFIFGMLGFTFGLSAFTTAMASSKKVKELEGRIADSEKDHKE